MSKKVDHVSCWYMDILHVFSSNLVHDFFSWWRKAPAVRSREKAILMIQGFGCVLSLCQHSLEPKIQAVSWLLRCMSHTNVVCHVGVIAVCLCLWNFTSCFRQGNFKKTLLTVWNDKATATLGADHTEREFSCVRSPGTSLTDWPHVSCHISKRDNCVYRTPCLQISEAKAFLKNALNTDLSSK